MATALLKNGRAQIPVSGHINSRVGPAMHIPVRRHLNQHLLAALPRRLDPLGRGRKCCANSVLEEGWAVDVWNALVHKRAVLEARDMRVEALVGLRPAATADLAAAVYPLLEAVEMRTHP